jgi:flagellar biosynthesis GTPase FlhF
MSMAFWKRLRFTRPSFRFPRWLAKKPKTAKRRTRGFEVAADEKLAFWSEKVPLTMAMIAQALVITRWYIGREAPASVAEVLVWANVVIAIFAGVAIDLVMVTTVMARRKGRRGIWGILTAASAAVASALIALDVYGGWSPGPYLHIAYPVVVFLFAMHLSSPRLRALNLPLLVQRRQLIRRLLQRLRSSLQEGADLRSRFAEVSQQLAHSQQEAAQLRADLAHRDTTATYADNDVAQLRTQLAQSQQEAAQLRTDLAQQRGSSAQATNDLAQLRTQLAQREQELAQARADAAQHKREMADLLHTLPSSDDLDLTAIAQRLKEGGTSWRDIELLLRVPQSTLRNRLKALSNGHLNGVA